MNLKTWEKINPHKICKKLGSKSMRAISSTGARSFKCRTCSVTYTEKTKKIFLQKQSLSLLSSEIEYTENCC